MFHPIDDCEHPLLCLPGTGLASQETAVTGSLQQNLAGVFNSVNLVADYGMEHRSPKGGARERTQGAEGVCNPIGGITI